MSLRGKSGILKTASEVGLGRLPPCPLFWNSLWFDNLRPLRGHFGLKCVQNCDQLISLGELSVTRELPSRCSLTGAVTAVLASEAWSHSHARTVSDVSTRRWDVLRQRSKDGPTPQLVNHGLCGSQATARRQESGDGTTLPQCGDGGGLLCHCAGSSRFRISDTPGHDVFQYSFANGTGHNLLKKPLNSLPKPPSKWTVIDYATCHPSS